MSRLKTNYLIDKRLRRFLALLSKEATQIVRDPSSILIAFVLPLILLFLFGYGVSLDTNRVRVGLVVEAPGGAASSLAAAFRGSRFFEAVPVHDRREVESELVAGRIRGMIVIPAEFNQNFAQKSGAAQIQTITDGSDPNTAEFVQNYAKGVWATWLAIEQARNSGHTVGSVTLEPRFWFNPELKSRYFIIPGLVAIIMTLVGTMLTALVVAREWERGAMEAMMATPVTALELLLSKLLSYFVLALLAMGMSTIVAIWVFGVPFRGSIVALLAISTAFLFPALGQGLMISAATKNQFVASQAALLSGFLPAMLLSGFIFEINSMPAIIQWITVAIPARYLIPCLQTVFVAGDIWKLFLPNMAAMGVIGTIFFAITVRNTQKRLD